MDAQLAVIGLGSIGSMALWQASRLTDSVVGFEAATPAHGRSAVGGDTRLFRMIYLGRTEYYPIIDRSRGLWAELEAETGQEILTTYRGAVHRDGEQRLYQQPPRDNARQRSRAPRPQPGGDGGTLSPAQPPP